MARMIPSNGPKSNDSRTAEPAIYHALKQLSDDFTVIHSLPWLGSAAREITGNVAITGEIDFLILHPNLGILAIEVKGGMLRYDQGQFVFRNGQRIDPIAQVRKGVHALSRQIKGATGLKIRIGYAIAFPESSMQNRLIPPALVDMTNGKPENICIDRMSIINIGQRIKEIMEYWHKNKVTWSLGRQEIDQIIRLVCPVEDYSLTWKERIEEDNQRWLVLTDEQSTYLQRFSQQSRILLTGRSGTGKTLLATTRARQLSAQGKRVLFVVYNVQLAIALKREVAGISVEVTNFHQLCRKASMLLKQPVDNPTRDWYKVGAPDALKQAIHKKLLPSFDALIIDEAQVFNSAWLKYLSAWFSGKDILACCDETQVFEYEQRSTVSDIVSALNIPEQFLLTQNMRSPRPVFKRLEALIPASYTQQSSRPDEPDSLQEIIDDEPVYRLKQTIKTLNDEGVPPQSIMLIHFLQQKNTSELSFLAHELEKMVGQIIPVYRCRGLESPIVIIWANTTIDDKLLLCAYSRATSKCIVIYALGSFSREETSPLYDTVGNAIKINLLTEKMFPAEKFFDFQVILTNFIDLHWSMKWHGWIITENKNYSCEEVTFRFLWIEHIRMTSTYPIYAANTVHGFSAYSNIHCYCPFTRLEVSTNLPGPSQENLKILWCEKCELWVLHRWKTHECINCGKEENNVKLPDEAGDYIKASKNLLAEWGVVDAEQETIFMVILELWVVLSEEQKIQIYKRVSYDPNNIYTVSKLYSGIYIINTDIGEEISITKIFKDSLSTCPWLNKYVDLRLWLKNISMSLGKWYDHGWLTKLSKGVYQRNDLSLIGDNEGDGHPF